MAGLDLASAAAAQLSGDTLQCLGRIETPLLVSQREAQYQVLKQFFFNLRNP
jgi:hypothetical protein